jgi:hypothetical protein
MSNKREIIWLPEAPRSSTPEPALKRPRKSRATSKSSVPKSSRPEESTAVTTRSVRSPTAREPAPRGASRGRPARTPSAERSSDEEPVAEGSLPAAERSSGEELVAVVGSPGSHLLLNGPRERSSWQRVCYQPLKDPRERARGGRWESWARPADTGRYHDFDGGDHGGRWTKRTGKTDNGC